MVMVMMRESAPRMAGWLAGCVYIGGGGGEECWCIRFGWRSIYWVEVSRCKDRRATERGDAVGNARVPLVWMDGWINGDGYDVCVCEGDGEV